MALITFLYLDFMDATSVMFALAGMIGDRVPGFINEKKEWPRQMATVRGKSGHRLWLHEREEADGRRELCEDRSHPHPHPHLLLTPPLPPSHPDGC